MGGPAKHVSWLASGMDAYGYETTLVCGNVPEAEVDMTEFALDRGVEPVVIPEMSRELTWKDLVAIYRIFFLMRRLQPDVVHTHTAKAGTVGRVAAVLYRLSRRRTGCCRVVHTYHGHVFHGYYGRLKTGLFLSIERCLAHATDAIITISNQQREEINETYRIGRKDQFRVIPLGLDLTAFQKTTLQQESLRSELGVPNDTLIVGIIGRLTEIKNLTMFLDVVARIRGMTKPPQMHFVVIGDGHLREKLVAYSAENGTSDVVTFLGFRSDVDVLMGGLDVVALTSVNEGTPLTLLEAMCCGVPVISTLVGGVGDLLGANVCERSSFCQHERGISVSSLDVEGMANGLVLLATDSELRERLARAGRNYVQRQHGKERLCRNTADLYDQLFDVTTEGKSECVC